MSIEVPKDLHVPKTIEHGSFSKVQAKQKRPELQIHCAATLIAPGDPFSKNVSERHDQAGEIAQFCVPIEPKFVGHLKRHHIDMAFEALKNDILKKLRLHGVMGAGE